MYLRLVGYGTPYRTERSLRSNRDVITGIGSTGKGNEAACEQV